MKCPICDVELKMSERQGVEIDYCPKCRGVWLDRGELDKIIEKSTEAMVLPDPEPQPEPRRAPEPRRDYREPYRDERRYEDRGRDRDYDKGYYKRKKRKSILSEIFDFD